MLIHSLAAIVIVAFCAFVNAGPVFINAGGNELSKIGWRCDTGKFATPGSFKYNSPRPSLATGGWRDVYKSHRWVSSGDLEYKIPVPPGKHVVFLMFAETWSGSGLGVRQFKVKINGEDQFSPKFNGVLDVFKVAGGLYKPFFFNAGPKPAVNGFITITLERIPGKNNPFISGIALNSEASDQIVGSEGVGSCATSSTSTPSPSPSSSAPAATVPPSPQPTAPPGGTRCGVAKTVTGKLQGAFVMNVGGPAVQQIGWGADNINYIVEENVGKTAKAPQPVAVTGTSWVAPFQSHRYAQGPSLTYRIPVPAGTYGVALLHAESFMSAAGQRTFDIEINGVLKAKAYDVFKLVGKNKPLYKAYQGIQSVDGHITIAFKKVKENPFVNGIYIFGAGAGTLAIGGPENGVCIARPTPTPTALPTMTTGCKKDIDTTFADSHAAHAVAGGPYVKTDFQNKGYAAVTLDGMDSHSHAEKGDEGGEIVSFTWMWKDPKNPLADENGTVTVKKLKTTQNFPQGTTSVTLLVIDQFCNPASQTTTVTVNSATMPGAYCYYYDFGSKNLPSVPLPVSLKADPKPKKGLNVGDINFADTKSFLDFPFKSNSFAVRCVFYLDVKVAGPAQYKVIHNGPVKAYHDGVLMASSDSKDINKMTLTKKKNFAAGLQEWQILYLRPQKTSGKLIFQFGNGKVIPKEIVRHDSGRTLPVVTGLSKATGSPEEDLLIFGTAFVNGVKVKFGTEEAQTIETNPGVVQVRAPFGKGTVDVTVTTQAGVSNGFKFTYAAVRKCPVPKFKSDTIKTLAGEEYKMKHIAVIKYGPDGRLYCGALNSKVYALTLDKDFKVTKKCTLNVFENNLGRAVLGLGFDPTSSALKLYFTTSTISWKVYKKITNDDFFGWTNGKVKSVTMAGPNGCFNRDLADVVTGLPVSNHDHGVQSIQFLQGGKMIISVGGFTNGGLPHFKLGDFHGNPLAGALVECPTSGHAIQYTHKDPLKAKIQNPTSNACKTYATGFRNSYGMELHTNRNLYATDNGPNETYGNFTVDCAGVKNKPSKDIGDKLILVEPGRCHGHPSLNRGRNGSPEECAFEDSRCVEPLLKNLNPSTNGVMEYKSNTFCESMRGNLFLSRFGGTSKSVGRVSRVILDADGKVAKNGVTKFFWPDSGLSLVEGPRGELVMSRVRKDTFLVLRPDYKEPKTTFFISVMPRTGPAAGGTKILVTGHNFGTTPSAKLGSKECTNVQSIDDESFTCITPPGKVDLQVTITVTGSAGISTGVGVDYWYF